MGITFSLTGATEVLERTPATLRALLEGVSHDWTRGNEGPDTFSPFDVVGHLIDAEETDWIVRARIILAQAMEPFPPFDRFRHRERNAARTLPVLLDEFAMARRVNLEILRQWNLTPAQLALEGVHPSLGRVTLSQLLATWVVHDLGHVAQVTRVMAKQYRGEVGAWQQYLPVLSDRETPAS